MSFSFGDPSSVRNKGATEVISLLSDDPDDDMDVDRSENTRKPPSAPPRTDTTEAEPSIIKTEPASSASAVNAEAQDQSDVISDASQTVFSNRSTREVTSSASSDDDLPFTEGCKRARESRAKGAPAKQSPQRPYANIAPPPFQAGFDWLLGQIKRPSDFFASGPSPLAELQEMVKSESSASKKRKLPYDTPNDRLLLNSSEVDEMVKNKDELMEMWQSQFREEIYGRRHRPGTSRTHKPKPSTPVPRTAKAPTSKPGQGQPPVLLGTAVGDGGQSDASHAPARARATSLDRVSVRKKSATPFEQLLKPVANTQSSTVGSRTIPPTNPTKQIPAGFEQQLHKNRDKDSRSREESLSLFVSPQALTRPFTASAMHSTATHGTTAESSHPDAFVLDDDEGNGTIGYVGSGPDRRPERRPEYTKSDKVTPNRRIRQLKRLAAAKEANGMRDAQQSQPLTRKIGPSKKSHLMKPKKAPLSKGVHDIVNSQRPLAAVNNTQSLHHATSGLEPALTDSRPTYSGHPFRILQPGLAASYVAADPYESTPEADPQMVFPPSSSPPQPATRKHHAPTGPQRSTKPNGLQLHRHPERRPQSAAHQRMNGPDADEDDGDDDDLFGSSEPSELVSSSLQGQLLSAPATQRSGRLDSQFTLTQLAPPVVSRKLTFPTGEDLLAEMQVINRKVAHEPRQTRIVDLLSIASASLNKSVLPEVSRAMIHPTKAQARISKEESQISESEQLEKLRKLISERKKRIPQEVRRKYPGETQEFYDEMIKTRFEDYIANTKKKYTANQEKLNANLLPADVSENVQDDEQPLNGQGVDHTANLNTKRVPAYEAIGERLMAKWVVRASEPYIESAAPDLEFRGTKEFLSKCEANKYARQMLFNPTPPITSKKSEKKTEYNSLVMGTDAVGLLFGKKRYSTGEASGKWVQIFIEEDTALASDFPNVLRDKFVDEEIVHRNAPFRLEVTLHKSYPEASKEPIRNQDHERATKQARVVAPEIQATIEEPAAEEVGDPQGLDGEGVRQVFAMGPPGLGNNFRIPDEEDSSSETSSQTSNDGIQADSDETDHDESDVINLVFDSKPLISFTEQSLRLANEYALDVAKQEWKPRIPHYCAQAHYDEYVLPYLTAQHKDIDLDKEELVLEFPEYPGKFDHRIWGFLRSTVQVDRLELKGPVDYAISYSRNANDAYRPEIVQAAAEEEEQEALEIAKLAALRSIPGLGKKPSGAVGGVNDADSEADSDGLVEEQEDEDLSEED